MEFPIWFYPKGGQVVCSQAAPQHQTRRWEEDEFQAQTADLNNSTGTQRENWSACEIAPKQPPFTSGTLSKPEAVSFEKWLKNSGCSGEIWPVQNKCTQRLQIHHPIRRCRQSVKQSPFPLNDGFCFQGRLHLLLKILLAFFFFVFPFSITKDIHTECCFLLFFHVPIASSLDENTVAVGLATTHRSD